MNVLLIVVCPFVLFLLAIVLSALLRYTDSDCPFGIFKLFLQISSSGLNIEQPQSMTFLSLLGCGELIKNVQCNFFNQYDTVICFIRC
jgi:hypothetical protein